MFRILIVMAEPTISELVKAGYGLNELIAEAQGILSDNLRPDDQDSEAAINALMTLLDGPRQRAIQAKWAEVSGGNSSIHSEA